MTATNMLQFRWFRVQSPLNHQVTNGDNLLRAAYQTKFIKCSVHLQVLCDNAD